MNLRVIVQRYYRPATLQGSDDQDLIGDLKRHANLQSRLYGIVLGAVITIFVLGVASPFIMQDSQQAKLVSAALGASAIGTIEWMRRIAREWGRTDLLITLMRSADPSQKQEILKRLMDEWIAPSKER